MSANSTDAALSEGFRHWINAGAGPRSCWPQSLRLAVDFVLSSPLPMLLVWGAQRATMLNDACLLLVQDHQFRPGGRAAWSELVDASRAPVEAGFGGRPPACADAHLPARGEGLGPRWCRLYFTPIHDAGPEVQGVICTVVDMSAQIEAQQRQQRAETELANRAAAFSIVYSNMQDVAYHVTRGDDGQYRFVSVNKPFTLATGLPAEAIIGKFLCEVIPEPSCSLVLGRYREAIERKSTVRWEETTRYPAGQKVGVVSVTPIFDAHGECTDLIGTVHDITELKQVEQQLRTANAELERMIAEQTRLAADFRVSEERLRFALETAGEGVFDWDIANDRVFYSKRWKEIVGRSGDVVDTIAMWWNLVHPDDLANVMQHVQACRGGVMTHCVHEHRLQHASGHYIWIQARGSVMARDGAGVATRMVGTIVDITAATLLRQELEHSYQLLTKLTQQVPGVLFEFVMQADGRTHCPYISAMSQELFERSPQEIEADFGCLMSRVYRPDRPRMLASLRQAAEDMKPWRTEYRVMLPKGGMGWHEINAKPTSASDGAILWHGFATDISERKRIEQTIRQFNETLERRAHYDALTGLPNRVLFRDRLEHEMRHAQIAPLGMALLFLDLDRFKEVNDLLGHDAGDALLVQAARRIEQCLRPGDTVARLGGDEFTVILTEMGELAHVEQTAQHILDALCVPFQLGQEQVNLSGSIGITIYPGDGQLPEELMRNADHAMYRSKAAGRNQLTFFENAMQEAAMRRLKLINELRHALPDRQLELHYQPIVDIETGVINKAEALLRWRRPGHELTLPNDFVGLAEETGLIHDIGNWVFLEASRSAQRWSALLRRPFQVSVNKSPVQFHPHVPALDWVAQLKDSGMPAHSIAVEITEGVLLNLTDKVFDNLHELQEGGVEVSIDDFGTGYSSMSYLKRLDIDYLKIDRSFVKEMLHDSTTHTITETIIVMAHKLGLKVIAEGVELREQLDWLAAHECDYAQGFLFAEPVTDGQFERMLVEQPFVAAARPLGQGAGI